jgi:hypothetical protein
VRTLKPGPATLAAAILVSLAAALMAPGVLVPGEVAAQEPTISGTWRHLDLSAERESRYLAIDRATESIGGLMRNGARSRLRDATAPESELTIEDEGQRVTLVSGGRRVVVSTDGASTRVSGDSSAGTMTATRRDGRLVVTVRSDDATRTTVYRLSADGARLTLEVRLTSGRLSGPVAYHVTYARR